MLLIQYAITKEGQMRSPCTIVLFEGQRLTIYPWIKARALEVLIPGPFLTLNICRELLELIEWLKEHSEVHSVLLKASGPGKSFGEGFDFQEFKTNGHQIEILSKKIEELQKAMVALPQVFICDLAKGASNISLELAMGAQIHLAHEEAEVTLNHALFGTIPGPLTLKYLKNFKAFAFPLLLSGMKIKIKGQAFLAPFFYQENRSALEEAVLIHVASLAPVARIHLKLDLMGESQLEQTQFNHCSNKDLDEAIKKWDSDEKPQFVSAKDYSLKLKKSGHHPEKQYILN